MKLRFKNLLQTIKENKYYMHLFVWMGMGFSFLIVDVLIRYFSNQYVMLYKFTHASPLFFSISWILLWMGILYLMPKKARKISYSISIILVNILALAQMLYMKSLNRFFGLSDLFMVGEGKDYFLYALKKIDCFQILVLGLSLGSMILTMFLMRRTKEFKKNWKYYTSFLLSAILLFGGFRYAALNRLGEASVENGWESSYNVRNVYNDFNHQSKNMEVAGLYEQTFRNSYLYIKNIFSLEKDKIHKELDSTFESIGLTYSTQNKYTGKLKGQNVIVILLESIDSFLVNKEVMPTLTKLQSEGLDFVNRYAPVFGGGQTINSEYAVNTGLYAISNSKAIYNFDSNYYPYSLANSFLHQGYSVESVHVNYGRFYNRERFHQALGYTNHHSLYDEFKDSSYDYSLDTSLIKDENVLDLIIREDKFLTFITTYSAHLPYDDENENCKNSYGLEVDGNKELSCVRNLARETDEFLKLLLEKLEESGKLDNTTLVLFSDHYMYGYSDLDYILEYKDAVDVNLVQNVPFIIWSKELKHKQIDTIMDTADILPTVLNLFGLEYVTNYYAGTDVFSKTHEDFVYFDEGIFYDGILYYQGKNDLTEDNQEYVNETLATISKKIDINNKIILSDYYQYLSEKEQKS